MRCGSSWSVTGGWDGWSSSTPRPTASRWPASSTSTRTADGAGVTAERCRGVDVAIDFSRPEARSRTVPQLAALGIERRRRHHRLAGARGRAARAVLASRHRGRRGRRTSRSARTLFDALAQAARPLFADVRDYGAWIHEAHHAAKKDAPSGTALQLQPGARARRLRAPDRRVVDARRASSPARTRSASTARPRRSR